MSWTGLRDDPAASWFRRRSAEALQGGREILKERCFRRRRGDAPDGAREQLDAQLPLEGSHGVTERGLGDAEAAGGAGKTAIFRDGGKDR